MIGLACRHAVAIEELRLVGDTTRQVYGLCARCRARCEAGPDSMRFVPSTAPEWQIRAAERRLPAKIGAAL